MLPPPPPVFPLWTMPPETVPPYMIITASEPPEYGDNATLPPTVPGRPPLTVPPNSVNDISRATRMLPPWNWFFVVSEFAVISPVPFAEQSHTVRCAL